MKTLTLILLAFSAMFFPETHEKVFVYEYTPEKYGTMIIEFLTLDGDAAERCCFHINFIDDKIVSVKKSGDHTWYKPKHFKYINENIQVLNHMEYFPTDYYTSDNFSKIAHKYPDSKYNMLANSFFNLSNSAKLDSLRVLSASYHSRHSKK